MSFDTGEIVMWYGHRAIVLTTIDGMAWVRCPISSHDPSDETLVYSHELRRIPPLVRLAEQAE